MQSSAPEHLLPSGSTVCAVVVTHHPDGDLPIRLARIATQVGEVVIVDNGSGAASTALLHAVALRPKFSLIESSENLGIARALNMGVARARNSGYAWALLLDQDTLVDETIVAALLSAHRSHPQPHEVAVVGSRFRDTHGRAAEPSLLGARGAQWEEVESVITSGSLLSLDAYAAVGPFRDEFFIDYVDTEFCFRARASGYRIIESRIPLMSHTVGSPTAHRLLGETKWTTHHSADRRYYIARNNTVLLREYGTTGSRAWRMKSVVRSVRLCKRIALFEQDKFAKILAVAQGWWDGVRGRMGPRAAKPEVTKPRL
jgi:rhamnosyltransferase